MSECTCVKNNMKDKEADLINENMALKAQNAELADIASKAEFSCEKSENVISELKSKIRFLEGQVEAYQYCLNCRR